MMLVDVYKDPAVSRPLLFELLRERTTQESISHRAMPTWEQHVAFVDSRPYEAWYLVYVDGYARGAVYLSKQREIGVSILRGQRGHRYGVNAVAHLMRLHPGRFLANVNPHNERSIKLFHSLGFSLLQHTYVGPTGNPYERGAA